MFFEINPSNGVAIFEQIARQVKYAVANGALRVGELVPSVRELATKLAVNPNTVARAYRDLQADGFLEPIRGEGLRVTRQATERSRKHRTKLIQDRIRLVVVEAKQSGITEEEFYAIVDENWKNELATT
ncbi:MAG: GntR family transcriptional regulator [Schlesneria sp.]